MNKVSFDFDGVFEYDPIQKFAKNLISKGVEVHVVTARSHKGLNADIFELTDAVNIERKNVHFTNSMPKFIFFKKHEDFKFHLDDDTLEVKEINENTSVVGILYDEDFEKNCLKEIQ